MKNSVLMVCFVLLCSSCAAFHHGVDNTVEFGKTVWGSSTRVLEQERVNAISKTYDKSYWDTLRAAIKVIEKKHWVVFMKDEVKGYVDVMGIKGSVNTTEIGIFFDELSDTQTQIQISSLSTNAKRKVAKGLFHGLDIAFGYVPPDPPEPKDTDVSENADTDQNAETNENATSPTP